VLPGRLVALLVVVSAAVAGVDVALVAGWIDPARHNRAAERNELEERLLRQNEQLGSLQGTSDDDRAALYDAIDGLTDVLNQGRVPASIPAANQRWKEVAPVYARAEEAKGDLPKVTQEILETAADAGDDARLLLKLEKKKDRLQRWRLLARAMDLMTETHRIYSQLNGRLIEGFGVYERLQERTVEWMRKQQAGDFGAPELTAQWYTHESDPLLPEMVKLRRDLTPLEENAQEVAAQAKAAFDLVEKEVEAGSGL
jgi:hypothetical protein